MKLRKMMPIILFLCIMMMMLFMANYVQQNFGPAEDEALAEARLRTVASAVGAGQSDAITVVGGVAVSRTEMAFRFQNHAGEDYLYGHVLELARFTDGQWLPMPFVRNAPEMPHASHTIQGRELQQLSLSFRPWYGELAPGRYMFIFGHVPRDRNEPHNQKYLLVEFEINEDTPLELGGSE